METCLRLSCPLIQSKVPIQFKVDRTNKTLTGFIWKFDRYNRTRAGISLSFLSIYMKALIHRVRGISMEDSKILDLYWARDEGAIKETQAKYGGLCYSIAINILSSPQDSEECVNDTYNKAWQSIPPQAAHSLAAYLGRIVRNLSINRWNKNHAQKRGLGGRKYCYRSFPSALLHGRDVEGEIQSREITKVLNNWLRSLSQGDRVLFLRRYWFCETLNALAREWGTTPNKLAGRMYRPRQSLRIELEKEGIWL